VLLYGLLTHKKAERLHLAHLRPSLLSKIQPAVRDLLLHATQHQARARFKDVPTLAVAEVRDTVFGLDESVDWMSRFREPNHPEWDTVFAPLRAWLATTYP
jgi:hypothetical protein